jgi:uncharacterized SAM-binding protein YcdF (DUF218 family)
MFLASKIVNVLLQPGNLFLGAVLAGTVMLFGRRARLGRGILVAALTALAATSLSSADQRLLALLEDRFPPPPEPLGRVDGIIVLGGSVNPAQSAARGGAPSIKAAADRLTGMMILARRFPDAKVVFTGGSGDPLHPELREAPMVRRLLQALGSELDGRILFEEDSRNTHENAVFSLALARPRPGEVWLLVTSAAHMPRSVGVFRAAGWPVVPYPVDYATGGSRRTWLQHLDPQHSLGTLNLVMHEVVGLLYYRLRGWTDDLFPAPRDFEIRTGLRLPVRVPLWQNGAPGAMERVC